MADMVEKKIKTATPLYAAAVGFLLGALLLPVYRLWGLLLAGLIALAAGLAAAKKYGTRTVLVPAPAPSYATGEAGLDATLTKAAADLTALHALNERIPEPQLSENIARMERAGRAILAEAEKKPQKAKSIRKFATYYLPTAIKLLGTYAEISATGARGENANSLMAQIRANAATIATAFEAQLDALFAGEELDVSSDLAVLDGMVKGDGLTGADDVQRAASAGITAGAKAAQNAAAVQSEPAEVPEGPTLTL